MTVNGESRSIKKAVLHKGTVSGGITAVAAIAARFICGAVGELEGQEVVVTAALAAILGTIWNMVKPWLKVD
jgi:hypothetical protein